MRQIRPSRQRAFGIQNGPLPFHRHPIPAPVDSRHSATVLFGGLLESSRTIENWKEYRGIKGKEKRIRIGMVHHHMPRVRLESDRPVISRKFSSEGLTICLSVRPFPNPIDSLFSLFPIVYDHSCYSHQRASARIFSLTIRSSRSSISHSSNSNASLPGSRSFWGRWGAGGNTPKSPKDAVMGHEPQMTIARTRLLTLCYGDMETIRMVCKSSPQIHYDSSARY